MDPYVGQLSLVGFNFAPRGWATASGQLMAISQNTALFSLLGTFYGGDGRSTFGLPNLQDSVAVGFGQLAGGSYYNLGETGGSQTVTLLASETPNHTHNLLTAASGKVAIPTNNSLANAKGESIYSTTTTPASNMSTNAVSTYGGGQPHNNMMPYQCLLWVIALQGVFPPRG